MADGFSSNPPRTRALYRRLLAMTVPSELNGHNPRLLSLDYGQSDCHPHVLDIKLANTRPNCVLTRRQSLALADLWPISTSLFNLDANFCMSAPRRIGYFPLRAGTLAATGTPVLGKILESSAKYDWRALALHHVVASVFTLGASRIKPRLQE
jgi:hypothetical protein